jgi:hypothetical protein
MDRRTGLALVLLTVSFNGCNCAGTRQAVYPNRRSSAVEVQTGEEVRVQAPFVDVRVPRKSTPEATEIDVPMLEH